MPSAATGASSCSAAFIIGTISAIADQGTTDFTDVKRRSDIRAAQDATCLKEGARRATASLSVDSNVEVATCTTTSSVGREGHNEMPPPPPPPKASARSLGERSRSKGGRKGERRVPFKERRPETPRRVVLVPERRVPPPSGEGPARKETAVSPAVDPGPAKADQPVPMEDQSTTGREGQASQQRTDRTPGRSPTPESMPPLEEADATSLEEAESIPPLETAPSSDEDCETDRVEPRPPLRVERRPPLKARRILRPSGAGVNWDQEQWMDAPIEMRHVAEIYSKGMSVFGRVAKQAYTIDMRCGTGVHGMGLRRPLTIASLVSNGRQGLGYGEIPKPRQPRSQPAASSNEMPTDVRLEEGNQKKGYPPQFDKDPDNPFDAAQWYVECFSRKSRRFKDGFPAAELSVGARSTGRPSLIGVEGLSGELDRRPNRFPVWRPRLHQ